LGVPEDKAQDNFTDPESRIMKRAGGGFDPGYNGQTAVDDTVHIIVAAELVNCAADAGELPKMLDAVRENLGAYPAQTLADAGYRSEAVFEALGQHTDLIVALGREGKEQVGVNADSLPLTAAMADTDEDCRGAHGLPATQGVGRAAQRLDQECPRVPSVQHAWPGKSAGRVETRVHGAEPAAHGHDAHRLSR
jgi:hypothetical protein